MAKGNDSSSMAQQSKKKRNDDETDAAPDAGQKPIQLQRRRVWRACESCRRKKIKCDGCEPTCSQCASSGSSCTWLQTKDRGPLSFFIANSVFLTYMRHRKAALSRHYVQELEARLLHMESIFSQIAPVLEQFGINGSDAAADASSANGSVILPPEIAAPAAEILRSIAPRDTQQLTSIPIKVEDDVSESLGQLALDEYGHMRWIGGSSTMSLIQSFKALTTSPLHRISPMEEDPLAPYPSANKLYFPASVFFGKVRALPGPEEVEYPERDLADKMVNAYFSRFHFLMPVIDKPSFLRQYRNIMDNQQDHSLVRSETAFIALIFAVFACAANLVQDERLSMSGRTDEGGMGMIYYERSLILQYISHANTQTAHVQCFILLSSFLCSVNCLPQAWILVGQAVRTGQDLGLHVSAFLYGDLYAYRRDVQRSPRRLVLSPIEIETRRKIWWGVYTLDRMLAVALGRPLGINDSDCDVEYPIDVDDDNLAEYFSGSLMAKNNTSLMTGIIALIKLYHIGGRVLRDVYAIENCKDNLEPERKAELQRMVESLDNELTQWCDDLPNDFKNQPTTDEQVSMGAVLCSHYYSVLTTLHRNMLPVKRDQPVAAKSTAKAVSSARSCIRLAPSMKNVVPPSHHLAFFIQHLFSSAVILLLYAMHSTEARAASAAMEEAKSTLSALQSWEGHWPGARKCRELLLELTNTATEAIAQARASQQQQGSETGIPISVAPSMTSPAMHERQRSLSGTSPSSVAGRALKGAGRTRRTQSRESGATSRRMAAVSPYRVDTTARARSSSRRRGLDEELERAGSSMGPYFHSLSSPTNGSSHSSPASINIPSPITNVPEGQEASPTLASAHTFNYGSPGLSATQIPSPRYDSYDFGISNNFNNYQNSTQPQWNGQQPGVDIYPAENVLYRPSNGIYPSQLENYSGFDTTSTHEVNNGLNGLSTTPPSSSFDAPGLPFRGLEFIRNYNPGGYSASDNFMGEQESLWQSYDPTSFNYNPDLPFTLGDPDVNGTSTS
ncbi:putative fungal-specific transcription factor [Lentinula detonsa]|uniref:Fungal-specific transcription factor n=1 Tax=Lentinula detonsa TaxID=2804962 RepID=A0AA38PUK7_9AGAR|nr:putative fungal-specific transcription factor [Lentinula detonsa]